VLFVNTFGRRKDALRARQLREIDEIISGLQADIAAGLLSADGVKVGWSDVRPPLNAVDVTDGSAMEPWFARAYRVDVALPADARILTDERSRR
jgi:hypothetical protein